MKRNIVTISVGYCKLLVSWVTYVALSSIFQQNVFSEIFIHVFAFHSTLKISEK